MTHERPTADWDDTRLDVAFRSAFAGEPPAGLQTRVVGELTTGPASGPSWWPRLATFSPALVAAVVVVAILVAVNLPHSGPVGTPGPITGLAPSVSGTGPLTTPSATGSSLPWPFPDHVLGNGIDLDVLPVADALAVFSGGDATREIAVAGWESLATDIRFCTLALTGLEGRLANRCAYNLWLGDVPQPTSTWYDPPLLPAIRIVSAGDWNPDRAGIKFRGGSRPEGSGLAVIVVGHFRDPVAEQCAPQVIALCRSTFVVDAVPWTLTEATFTTPPVEATPSGMSIAEAVATRDESASPITLAVSGWFERNVVPCPQLPDAQVPLEDCINDFTWLMAKPEQLDVVASDGSGSVHAPNGPAISLVLDGLAPPATSGPAYALAVGHFHDPGHVDCPAAGRALACERRFVVDLLVRVAEPPFPAPP